MWRRYSLIRAIGHLIFNFFFAFQKAFQKFIFLFMTSFQLYFCLICDKQGGEMCWLVNVINFLLTSHNNRDYYTKFENESGVVWIYPVGQQSDPSLVFFYFSPENSFYKSVSQSLSGPSHCFIKTSRLL